MSIKVVTLVRKDKISKVEDTLKLYFTRVECHICGKKLLCVIPDNSDEEGGVIPLCKACIGSLFDEIEKAEADESYQPSLKLAENGDKWTKEPSKAGETVYGQGRNARSKSE